MAVWRSGLKPPNLITANISDYTVFCCADCSVYIHGRREKKRKGRKGEEDEEGVERKEERGGGNLLNYVCVCTL